MNTTTDPSAIAELLGVTVAEHTGGEKGRYYGHGLISIRADLGYINRRCTLAHELAHAALGHRPDATGWLRARQERAADQWAANRLIDTDAYRAAEQQHGPHPGAIAAELEVTTHMVKIWAQTNKAPRQ